MVNYMTKELRDITPARHRCEGATSMCPVVLQSSSGTYIVIGKKLDLDTRNSLSHRIGRDETVLEIPAELLEEIFAAKVFTDNS